MRNKIGPNKAPWGKPDKTEVQDEWCPRRTTPWYRLVRKLLSQDRSGPWIHLRVSLSKGVHAAPSQKLSKDLKKITSVDKPLSESLSEGLVKIIWQIWYFLDALTKTTKACLFQFKWYVTLFSKLQSSFIVSTAHLSFPSTPTLAKKKAFRTLLTQWILPHFRMLKYREPVNLAFVKEFFWKEAFFLVSHTKILILGR